METTPAPPRFLLIFYSYIGTELLTSHSHPAGYIGEFEIIDDHRSGKIVIQLNGRLNKTGVISPRFNIQVTQIESWVNLLLPSRGFGIIILVRLSLVHNMVEVLKNVCSDDIVWYPGPRRGTSQECWRQAVGICVLVTVAIKFCTCAVTVK